MRLNARLYVDQRRRLNRALAFNRLAFVCCAVCAALTAYRGIVIAAFIMLGCVVVIGITMACLIEARNR